MSRRSDSLFSGNACAKFSSVTRRRMPRPKMSRPAPLASPSRHAAGRAHTASSARLASHPTSREGRLPCTWARRGGGGGLEDSAGRTDTAALQRAARGGRRRRAFALLSCPPVLGYTRGACPEPSAPPGSSSCWRSPRVAPVSPCPLPRLRPLPRPLPPSGPRPRRPRCGCPPRRGPPATRPSSPWTPPSPPSRGSSTSTWR